MSEVQNGFKQWGILELMGHRRMAGLVSEEQIGGATFLRIDVPKKEGPLFGEGSELTQLYNPTAVYCFTPTTEEIARGLAAQMDTTPPAVWGLLPGREQREEEGEWG